MYSMTIGLTAGSKEIKVDILRFMEHTKGDVKVSELWQSCGCL